MNTQTLDGVMGRHRPNRNYAGAPEASRANHFTGAIPPCEACRQTWPCDAFRLASEWTLPEPTADVEVYLASEAFRERLTAALYIANAAAIPDDPKWRARLRRRVAMYQYVLAKYASSESLTAAEKNLDMAAEMITDLLSLDGAQARMRESYDRMRDAAFRTYDDVWAAWERARGDGSSTPSERLAGVLADMKGSWLVVDE